MEDQEFEEEFLGQEDPSMLHFLLASGEEVPQLSTQNHPCVADEPFSTCHHITLRVPETCFKDASMLANGTGSTL